MRLDLDTSLNNNEKIIHPLLSNLDPKMDVKIGETKRFAKRSRLKKIPLSSVNLNRFEENLLNKLGQKVVHN